MALSYKLISRRNLAKDAPADSRLYYAQTRATGEATLSEICSLIQERSTVSSADVKAVLDSLIFVMKHELANGRIVRLTDFGSFRITFGSTGTETEEEFTSACIRRPKYTFTPGPELRDRAKTLRYEKYTPEIRTEYVIMQPAPEGDDD
ncbi:MAG: HU family DNA-binding protein [Tannerellaceae bacterium]|nr:HU family DNA-binding protein [Tannerellaceae bacterium]